MPLDLPVLPQAYAQAAQALGPSAGAIRLSLSGPVPSGLATALARHNPDLARHWASRPDPATQLAQLAQSDRQVLAWLHQHGYLSQPVGNRVGQGLDAATAAFWATGDQRDMTVLIDREVMAQFSTFAPLPASLDQVGLRWFAVLHEAAHTQMNHLGRPFRHPAWSSQANEAMNRLVFRAPGMTEHPVGLRAIGIFRESFADAYGALMALRLAQDDPAMHAVLRYVVQVRQATTAARLRTIAQSGADLPASYVIFYDEHATDDTLTPLIADLEAGRLPDLATQTPAQLQDLAQRYASAGLARWLRGPEGVQAVNTFGWAHGVMSWQQADNTYNAGPFLQAERLRALRFIGDRAHVFSRADAKGTALPVLDPDHEPNPVLADMMRRDAERFATFQQLPAADRAAYAQLLAHPDPNARVPVAIQNWANRDTALADAATFRPAFRQAVLAEMSPDQQAAAARVSNPAVRHAAEVQRIHDYVDERLAAYAAAERHGDLRPAEAQGDPVLQILAAQDDAWYRCYRALPATERTTLWRLRTEITDSPEATPTPQFEQLGLAIRESGEHALADPVRLRALTAQMEADYRAVTQALGQPLSAPALAQVPFPASALPRRRLGR